MRVYASAEMTLTDTNDGISVTGIDRYYMASSSSSGITVDSQGWKPGPQETNPISRYHWSYEVVKYSDGAKIPSKPAVIGVYGKEGEAGVDAVTVSLSSEAHTFAGTESKAIASSITIDISAFKGNQRIPTSIGAVTGGITGQLEHSELGRGTTSNKLVINVKSSLAKGDGTLSIPIVADGRTFNKVFSWSVAFKGKTGDKGDTGKDGVAGKDGVGVQKTEVHYASSTSGTTKPSSGWNLQVPSTSPGDYIWTRTTWTYTDGDTEEGYSVSRIGKDGNTGKDGNPGKDGVGIQKTVIDYAASSSGTTKPTSGWDSTIPSVTPGNYLWTRTTWTYTDNDTEEGYSVARIGEKGDKGDPGPQGIRGPSGSNGQSQWVHIRYSANSNGSGMDTKPSGTTKYVGIAVTNSATAPAYTGFTWSKYVGENGSQGPQGVPGKNGANGTTTYTWVRYADTPTSGMENFPEGKKYIGLAFNKTTQTESNNYSDYQWSLMPQNIEVGGRNLLRNSKERILKPRNDGHADDQYNFEKLNYPTIDGQTYTISADVEITHGTFSNISVLVNYGNKGSNNYSVPIKNGKITRTYVAHDTVDNNRVLLYAGTSGNTRGNGVIFRNIKIEKGDTATDWTEAPEDIQSQIDEKANQTDTEARLNEIASELLVKQQEIEAAATAGELDAFVKKYNQEQEAFAKEKKASEEALASAEDAISLITNKMDNMAETWEFFDEYIKFEKGSIVLGNKTEGSHIRIHNDRISFYSNGYEVASITQGKMTIEAGTFVEEIQISEFKFQKSSNGHLTVRHVG